MSLQSWWFYRGIPAEARACAPGSGAYSHVWEKEEQPVQVHRKKMRVSATLVALALAMTACGGDGATGRADH